MLHILLTEIVQRRAVLAILSLGILSVLTAACQRGPEPVQTTVAPSDSSSPTPVETTPPAPTITPSPTPLVFSAPDPSVYVLAAGSEPVSLNPALAYDAASAEVILNVYETLVFYRREAADEFIPQLATGWEVSPDGLTYTFQIRPGVKFHAGGELSAADAAYALQRALLQGSLNSPHWLLAQPLLGVDEISLLVDPAGSLAGNRPALLAAAPQTLQAACEKVQRAITADPAEQTLTLRLAKPWAPFLAALAQSGAAILDREWAVANGGWNGDCSTWAAHYALAPEEDPFSKQMNGTGPFRFSRWVPGEAVYLERFDLYWRTEPAWDNGPAGLARFGRVEIRAVPELEERIALLAAGEADNGSVPPEAYPQLENLVGERCVYGGETGFERCAPTQTDEAPLRLFQGFPEAARMDFFFNFDIADSEGANPFIGSGALDGDGIPPDFFADVHIRRAFNYCFDRQAFIDQALNAEAYLANGLLLPGMPGAERPASQYSLDLETCAQAFQASELRGSNGETVWEAGFRMQVVYPAGDARRQVMNEILARGLAAANPRFRVEVLSLPWTDLVRYQRANMLPLFTVGWIEDVHDPHHWVDLYLTGAFARSQNMPVDLILLFGELVDQGVETLDRERRAAAYTRLNELVFEQAPQILLPLPTGRRYEQRWVEGWYPNPVLPGTYFYALAKR